ncbi:redox-sensitive transcriptional activator SoxR [Roseateles sp.]|uniref:redox-sensitive transcriptional activator SoxR n=1 Tax=Roseateles sp. TaxID=1971397 RepID=UPI0025E0AFEA|nr:redox-sensitive transcriptional activator SoxR [Roseateles sp.]MBV8037380.1 redox-sensitive transcriptional activator SoxR [Roseateles sp.]
MLEVQVNLKSSSPAPLTIGQLARRAGVATSALRFYEAEGLITGSRSAGGHRQYPRHVLRRVAFIRAAQVVGLSLPQIKAALATLPQGRTPTKADWTRLSASWAPLLDKRIKALQKLRDRLTGCIGCGCLSLKTCTLYNPQDQVAAEGAGARLLRIETTP